MEQSDNIAEGVTNWQSEEQQNLIPGVPDDLTIDHILTKVPWSLLYGLSTLNRGWRGAIKSRKVHNARVRMNCTQTLVAIIHDPPAPVDRTGPKTAISLYEPCKDDWYLLPSIPGVRRGIPYHCAVACLDSRLYILGGADDPEDKFSIPKNEVYMLDLGAAEGSWKQLANMDTRREDFPCEVFDGKIYVFGGTSYFDEFSNEAEVFDPEMNTWHPIAPVLHHRTDSAATAVGGEIYVHGGTFWRDPCSDDDSDTDDAFVDATFAEVYNPIRDEWREVQKFTQMGSGPIVVVNGKLHIIGLNSLHSLDAYDVPSNSWISSQFISWQVLKRTGAFNVHAAAAVALDGELFALAYWARGRMALELSYGLIPLKSRGLGKPKRRLVWEKIDCGYSFDSLWHSLCPIQV